MNSARGCYSGYAHLIEGHDQGSSINLSGAAATRSQEPRPDAQWQKTNKRPECIHWRHESAPYEWIKPTAGLPLRAVPACSSCHTCFAPDVASTKSWRLSAPNSPRILASSDVGGNGAVGRCLRSGCSGTLFTTIRLACSRRAQLRRPYAARPPGRCAPHSGLPGLTASG